MPIGKLGEFNTRTGNWSTYCERIQMFFLVNNITPELRLPTLISAVGEEAYRLMTNLCSPKKPADLTFDVVVEMMKRYYQPKPSTLAERYKFRQYRQMSDQTVARFVTELRSMSRFCDFGTSLDENLRDQFVCGVRSDGIRQRLFAEENVTWLSAVSLALALEAAERDALAVDCARTAAQVQKPQEDIYAVEEVHNPQCLACGDTQHQSEESATDGNGSGSHDGSRSRNTLAVAYRGVRRRRNKDVRGSARGASQGLQNLERPGWRLADRDIEQNCKESMFQMSLRRYMPVSLPILIDNQLIQMEIDTGSALSCISEELYNRVFYSAPLQVCNVVLRFYDGSVVRPRGLIQVSVSYKGICKVLDLYIISNGTTSLLGRQWLAELNITIPKIPVHAIKEREITEVEDGNSGLQNVFYRYKEVFDSGLGCFTGERARLRLRPGAEPVFCRARPLPYALRARVDAELDAMLRAGIIEPVEHSDWATPLVFLLLPHFEDCNKYYKCVHGNEVERKCSGNTIFDFEEQVCNWRWATKCWLREIIDGSGDGDYSGYTGLEEENFDVNSAPEVAPASFHPTLDCNRAESASLQLSYMNDCQRFWRCHNGKITAAYCSDGLFFNAQTQMCDFEANVKCQTQMEDELQGEFIVYK